MRAGRGHLSRSSSISCSMPAIAPSASCSVALRTSSVLMSATRRCSSACRFTWFSRHSWIFAFLIFSRRLCSPCDSAGPTTTHDRAASAIKCAMRGRRLLTAAARGAPKKAGASAAARLLLSQTTDLHLEHGKRVVAAADVLQRLLHRLRVLAKLTCVGGRQVRVFAICPSRAKIPPRACAHRVLRPGC